MKWTHHRVSKSTWLFLLNMILVMTAAVLVLVNIRSRNELEESKRGFYSENASYLVNEEIDWNAIEDILEKDDWNNGILYKKDLQMAEDIRGVFYKGNFKKLPLISGRYFSGEEVCGDDRKAMIGRRFEKDVYEEGDRQYIDIMGEKFEVIGVLGSAQLTRLDSMKWIPLKAAAELTGAEGSYVVDGNSEKEIRNNTKLLWEVMDEDVNMQENVLDDWDLPDKTPALIEKIYFAIIAAFVLNMFFSGSYWIRYKKQKIQVEKLLGFSAKEVLASVFADYIKIAAAALILSGILIGSLILCHAVVAIRWQDFCLVSACIVFGELVVIGVPGSFYFFSRKIGLKRA